jgi:hypothetical protein
VANACRVASAPLIAASSGPIPKAPGSAGGYLQGPRGNGEDFDFFYFAGPSDFAKSFKLPAVSTLEALDDYFDARVKDDTNFKKAVDSGAVTKAGFRNYYGLRAAVSFSLGSHDEWNVARILNERLPRR